MRINHKEDYIYEGNKEGFQRDWNIDRVRIRTNDFRNGDSGVINKLRIQDVPDNGRCIRDILDR